MTALDILLLLLVTIGPTKSAAMYLSLTAGAEPALKRQIALRTVATAAIVCVTFALIGQGLLGVFHVSIPAMLIAGGIILFVFALHLVLDEEHADPPGTVRAAPSLDLAAYPLAVPLMASPQGLVAIVAISAADPGFATQLTLVILVVAVMAMNAAFMLFADRIFSRISPAILKVVLRVFGLLLCGLAVQLVIIGLTKLGVLAATAGH